MKNLSSFSLISSIRRTSDAAHGIDVVTKAVMAVGVKEFHHARKCGISIMEVSVAGIACATKLEVAGIPTGARERAIFFFYTNTSV